VRPARSSIVLAPDQLTAVILAGGRGRRLGGVCKPLLVVDGVTILARQRAVLTPRVTEVIVAIAIAGAPLAPELRHVHDPIPDAGPLAGLVAALTACRTPWLLAVAGDMPRLAPALLDALIARAVPTVDAVAPRVGGWPEPLCALWHVRTLPHLAARLADGRRGVGAALGALTVAWLEEPDARAIDPTLASFASVNRPDDL
jgi:molybdopterin-guanine dinucleotide biosynthesis protein A